jgi:glycosyltransferase involved in cell wall biosynthesis
VRVAINAEQLLFSSPGGIGRYTAQLVAGLPRLFADNEVVPLFARHPRHAIDEALRAAGASTETVALAEVSPLPARVLYEAWLRLGWPPAGWPHKYGLAKAEVVHAPSVAVPPRGELPLVVTVHDSAPSLFPQYFTARARSFHERAVAAVAERADLVITGSQTAAGEIAAHTPIPSDRLRVVPYGVEPPAFDPVSVEASLRACGLADRRYVLWVGSLEPRKGVGTLVSAMATLSRRSASPPADLVLAGFPGWLTEGIIDPADREALGDRLHQLGRQSEAQLWALYAGAAAFCFPSHHEGFGLPVLEAMSLGTPVVGSDIEALRELTAGCALLVAPGDAGAWADAIAHVLSDEAFSRRLGSAGKQRSSEYSLDACLRGVRSAYAEVASAS